MRRHPRLCFSSLFIYWPWPWQLSRGIRLIPVRDGLDAAGDSLGEWFSGLVFAAAVAQFPIYGMILGYGNVRRKLNSALMAVLGVHLLGATILPAAALVQAMLPSNRFEEAVRNNDVATARRLLDRGVDPNAHLSTGLSLLMLACMDGHVELAKLLLEKGADPNDRDIKDPRPTALFVAVGFGQMDIVKLLIDHGADISIKNLERRTVLDEALAVRDSHLSYQKSPTNLPYTPEQRARDDQIIALLEAATESQNTKGTQ
jgi:Ankyrin repeats (3 copies)